MAYQTKTYVVQKMTRDGNDGPVIAVKLTFQTAHDLAKTHAPARVVFAIADKSDDLNAVVYGNH